MFEGFAGLGDQPREKEKRCDVLRPPQAEPHARDEAREGDRGEVRATHGLRDVSAQRSALEDGVYATLAKGQERHGYDGDRADRHSRDRTLRLDAESQPGERRKQYEDTEQQEQ